MCTEWAKLSYATRKKVGALIVKDGQIISDGFNGTPAGFENICEGICGTTLRSVLHAESNAITKLAKSPHSSEGATLYLTLSPCYDCAKLIIQSGIKRVVYMKDYRRDSGLILLTKARVTVDKIERIDHANRKTRETPTSVPAGNGTDEES